MRKGLGMGASRSRPEWNSTLPTIPSSPSRLYAKSWLGRVIIGRLHALARPRLVGETFSGVRKHDATSIILLDYSHTCS